MALAFIPSYLFHHLRLFDIHKFPDNNSFFQLLFRQPGRFFDLDGPLPVILHHLNRSVHAGFAAELHRTLGIDLNKGETFLLDGFLDRLGQLLWHEQWSSGPQRKRLHR